MEEGITKLIFRMAVTIMFLSAVALFFMFFLKTDSLTDKIEMNIVSPNAVTDKSTGNISKFTTGAQIISSIMNFPETDIDIDSLYIPKSIDIYSFDYSSIDETADYYVEYNIDPSGVITKVIYTKM